MFETSDPKRPFYVLNQIDLYPQDEKILVKLYQPLVGAVAVSLYQTLIQDFDPYAIKSDAKGIYTLQEQLDCSLKTLFQSLHKLEAVGLVQTFLVDNKINQILAFKLMQVPDSQEFFATSLLASLLKEKVGQTEFSALSHYFSAMSKNKVKHLENAKDVSASFIEVFRLPMSEAINPSDDVVQAGQDNQIEISKKAEINKKDPIDWQFLVDSFARYHIPEIEIERNKSGIRNIMSTYGLSEQEFVDETLPTLHGRRDLDLKAIEKLLAESYRSNQTRKKIDQQTSNLDQSLLSKLSPDDRTLIEKATTMAPAEFLYEQKEQKGGFASPNEKRIITILHNQYGLPSDLINMLIYACLQYDTVVSANLAYKIANDWLQHGVSTSIQALDYLAKRKNTKAKQRRNNYQNKQVKKGTDWSKKKAKTDTNVNSEDLKNFFKNLEDKDK